MGNVEVWRHDGLLTELKVKKYESSASRLIVLCF